MKTKEPYALHPLPEWYPFSLTPKTYNLMSPFLILSCLFLFSFLLIARLEEE